MPQTYNGFTPFKEMAKTGALLVGTMIAVTGAPFTVAARYPYLGRVNEPGHERRGIYCLGNGGCPCNARTLLKGRKWYIP